MRTGVGSLMRAIFGDEAPRTDVLPPRAAACGSPFSRAFVASAAHYEHVTLQSVGVGLPPAGLSFWRGAHLTLLSPLSLGMALRLATQPLLLLPLPLCLPLLLPLCLPLGVLLTVAHYLTLSYAPSHARLLARLCAAGRCLPPASRGAPSTPAAIDGAPLARRHLARNRWRCSRRDYARSVPYRRGCGKPVRATG
eukprot:scaffold72176_cov31-Tisochrysis_lutea.AAC.1